MDFHVEEQGDHEEEEEEEEEENEGEDEEEDDVDAAAPTTYENSLSNPARLAEQATAAAAGDWGPGQLAKTAAMMIRYRECRKNHAVGIGKHAVDGCGEFLPSGPEGTVDALVCAACSCHRNFHRKENNPAPAAAPAPITASYPLALMAPPPQPHQYQQLPQATPSWYHHQVRVGSTPSRPLALPPVDENNNNNNNNNNNDDYDNSAGGSGTKRHRTKFTPEQKERMLGLAEKLGWRIQKHDEAEVERFCSETGVRRQVLKVWMHNNKLTLGKKP